MQQNKTETFFISHHFVYSKRTLVSPQITQIYADFQVVKIDAILSQKINRMISITIGLILRNLSVVSGNFAKAAS
jgi:hypothetical protein